MKKNKITLNRTSIKYLSMLAVSVLLITILYAQVPKWVAPASANGLKNPYEDNTAVLADGKQLYISYCSPCHGTKGKGDGPAAMSLAVKPADHTSSAVQGQTDGSLFWKMSEGRKPMPQFKTTLSEKQRWELVTYIRSLAAKKK